MPSKKILQFIIVIIIMGLSYGAYFFRMSKGLIKPEEEMVENEINPVGKITNGSIKEIKTREEFYKLSAIDYVVVSANDIVPTGVYTRKAWMGPYSGSSSTTRKNRRKNPIPAETTNPLTDIEYMNEYCFIKLPDGRYINAILDKKYINEIRKGKEVTLPIGQQRGITKRAKEMLRGITEEYNVKSTPVLYTLDDEWYSENQNKLNTKGMIWGVLTFIILCIIAAFTLGKVFED